MWWTGLTNLPCVDDYHMDTNEFSGVAPVLQDWIQGGKCLGTLDPSSPVAPPCVGTRGSSVGEPELTLRSSDSLEQGVCVWARRGRQNHPNTSTSTPTASPRPCGHPAEQTCTPCGPCPCRTGTVHILYSTDAGKGQIKTIYSWRLWGFLKDF